jgi:hypothetical protein
MMPSVKDPKIRPYRYRFLWETVGDAINMSPFPRPTHHEERVETGAQAPINISFYPLPMHLA